MCFLFYYAIYKRSPIHRRPDEDILFLEDLRNVSYTQKSVRRQFEANISFMENQMVVFHS